MTCFTDEELAELAIADAEVEREEREKHNIAQKRYYKAHRAKYLKDMSDYKRKNKSAIKAYNKAYYQSHKEQIQQKRKLKNRRTYYENQNQHSR